jgi:hypothetical protein
VKTAAHARRARVPSTRSRYGYSPLWWGHPGPGPKSTSTGYWSQTRRPIPCLLFVLPILVGYELGVTWIGGPSADALRTGADAWMRTVLSSLGLTDRWLLPVALVLGLVAWQVADPRSWRASANVWVGMVLESLGWGIVLIGLSRVLDTGLSAWEGRVLAQLAVPPSPGSGAAVISYLGAGVYEEALFRLALIPALYGFFRLLQTPRVLATSLAVTGSALLFSIAHHAGAPGEPFTWFAFVFRWLAGIYFAWVFVARGFGIAVGTHAAYDILVGWLGWHL